MMANHPVERTRLGGPLTGGVRAARKRAYLGQNPII